MKSASTFALSVFALAALTISGSAKDGPLPEGLIELHGDHAVLIGGLQSADGRYAMGWSVRPKKGKSPVKWSDYGKEGTNFRDDYCDNEDYVVTNVVVDLELRAIAATLPFGDPYFQSKGHGALEGTFGPEKDGRRFVVALSDGKWNPFDVAVADLGPDGASTADLLKTMDAGVQKYIGSQMDGKKHLEGKDYAISYQMFELPEIGLLSGFADAETVRIPFTAEIPKGEGTRSFSGTVQLKLSHGKGGPKAEVVEVKEVKEDGPEPTQDNPRVAAADKELNAAYTAARTAANAAGKAKLLEEQRAWIKDRDDQAAALHAKILEEATVLNPRFETDKLLLKLTQERTAALRGK